MERTELSELGEFPLIKRLTEQIKLINPSSVVGVGDDAAVLHYPKTEVLVSTDMLVEGIHFDLSYVPLKHLGYKSAIANFSDIYAMNGEPKQITVSIAVSNRFPVEAIEELYVGLSHACAQYGVDLVGGDTTSSMSGLIISITVIGEAAKKDIVYRSGAKETDLVVVSGDLGGAYMGLQVLRREKEVWKTNSKIQPDLVGNDYILERQLKPEARRDIIDLLKKLQVKPTAMIDISDGLASELIHICDCSDVGCRLYDEKLPIDPTTYQTARDFNLDPNVCVLSGGEDYELLFTINIKDHDKIKGNPNLTVIGHITEKSDGNNLIDTNGHLHELKAQGWTAFNEGKQEN